MSKARTLANLISDNAELADGQISVAEVVGAAPTANPTFTGNIGVAGNITNASGNLTLDVAGDIILDSDGGLIEFKNGGTRFGRLTHASTNLELQSMENSGDILLRGKDSSGNNVTALTLDMSNAGTAIFNHDIQTGLNAFVDIRDADGDISGRLRNVSGSNNALTIEADPNNSASGSYMNFKVDTVTAMTLNSSQRVLIGSDTAIVSNTAGPSTPAFQVQGADYADANISVWGFRDQVSGSTISLGHTRSSTVGAGRAILQDGDELGKIRFFGADGVDFDSYGADIYAKVDGIPSEDDMPGKLIFATTSDGGASSTERMQINSAGRVSMSGNAGVITVKSNAALTLSDSKAGDLGGNIAFHRTGNSGYATIGTDIKNDLHLEADPSNAGTDTKIAFYIDGGEVARFKADGTLRASNEFWITTDGYNNDTGLRVQPSVPDDRYGFDSLASSGNVVMSNEQGTTNQAMILSDIGTTDPATVFGISNVDGASNPSTGSESGWQALMDLGGTGVLTLPLQPASRVKYTVTGGEMTNSVSGSEPAGTLVRYGVHILPSNANVTVDERFDRGSNVNSNGLFTAPTSGIYYASFFFTHEQPDTTAEVIQACISIAGNKTDQLGFEAEQNPDYTIPRIQGFSGVYEVSAGESVSAGFVPGAGGLNFSVPTAIFSVCKIA